MALQYPHYSLRVPDDLLKKIKSIANENKRSLNKEIEFIMEKRIKEYEKQNGEIVLPEEEE